MTFPIKDGVAVLTGAGSGIGRATALLLAERGCDLALADKDAEPLAQTAARARQRGIKVSEHVFNVADPAAAAAFPDAVKAEHGRATILMNNAGVALGGTFDQISLEEFEWLMEINFWAPVRLTKGFLPMLRAEGAGHIVNISSLFGLIAPPGQTAYSASKFAIRGFSESLRHELQGSSVSLSVVHPGGIATSIADNARIPAALDTPQFRAERGNFNNFLVMPPEDAAARIVEGIEKRAPRILIGSDAKRGDLLQRINPAGYWAWMAKGLQKAMAKTAKKDA